MIITVCPRCGNFDPIRTVVNTTSFNQTLSCGQTYVFTVTAVTKLEVSAASQVTLALKPVSVEPVSNLTVKYFPGYLDGSGFIPDKDWIKSVDRFLLTWDPPKTLAAASIQVQCRSLSLDKQSNIFLFQSRSPRSSFWPAPGVGASGRKLPNLFVVLFCFSKLALF